MILISFVVGSTWMASPGPAKDINIPSLPWEADVPVAEPKDFNSPGDFVQQATNFQFQVNATRIIFSTLTNVCGLFLSGCLWCCSNCVYRKMRIFLMRSL